VSATALLNLDPELSANEREMLREAVLAVRQIRYGSVVVTIHDGRIVEVNKTERIRRNST
jgi:hypothetical protein